MNVMHLRSSGGFFGAEGVILSLATKLDSMGCINHVVCIDNLSNSHTELVDKAMATGLKSKSIFCKGRLDIKTISTIRSFIKENKIDILHCHDYKSDLFGYLASRFTGVGLVGTNHNWLRSSLSLRFYEFLDGIILNAFDKVVAVSNDVASETGRAILFKKNKITNISNGIDIDKYLVKSGNGNKIRAEFKIKPSTKIVVSAGRLSSQKGFDYLIEAMKKVFTVAADTVLLIAGEGPFNKNLTEMARKLDIEHKIIFVGNRTDMIDIYAAMDLFVLASLREGIPLVVLEAMAMKKPVIATRVGGVPTVIESGQNGILVEPKNSSTLSEAIIRILKDADLAKDLAENGRKTVEESFSAEKMAQKYKKVYEEVTATR